MCEEIQSLYASQLLVLTCEIGIMQYTQCCTCRNKDDNQQLLEHLLLRGQRVILVMTFLLPVHEPDNLHSPFFLILEIALSINVIQNQRIKSKNRVSF